MRTFEHDFLNFNFLGVPHFRTTWGASERWLRDMDRAAREQGVAIQFCMALPSDLMETLEPPGRTSHWP